LGAKGRDYLERHVGLPADFYFRPSKVRHLGHSHLLHTLLVTRICVLAHRFVRSSTYDLVHMRLSHELARSSVKVIPDAWVLLDDNKGHQYAVLIEIDRGMEYREKFTRHVNARMEFIRSGEYARVFGTQAVLIAYATTGQTPEYRETRRQTMCTWIMEVLAELGLEHWSGIFRVCSLMYEHIYDTPLFESPMWYPPDSDAPVPLLHA
jgi:hypothetical protein